MYMSEVIGGRVSSKALTRQQDTENGRIDDGAEHC